MTEFYFRKDTSNYRTECKSCYYLSRRDRQIEISPQKLSKRRAAKLRLPHVAYRAQDIYNRDQGVCILCGLYVESDSYHLDHVVPLQVNASLLLSYGITEHPGDVPWNVSVAHSSCNYSKGNRMTQEDAANYALLHHLYKE